MAQCFLPCPLCCAPSQQGPQGGGTHKLIASLVHVVLQVAAAIIGGQDGSQLPIASKMEAIVRGEHQQPCHVAPADFLLRRRWGYLPQFPLWGPHRGEVTKCSACPPTLGFSGQEDPDYSVKDPAETSFWTRAPVSGTDSSTWGCESSLGRQVPKRPINVWGTEGN